MKIPRYFCQSLRENSEHSENILKTARKIHNSVRENFSSLRFVTGKNDNIGCVTGKNFNKIRGKIALLCHGCHGLHFFDLSRARKRVTGNFF